MKKCGPQLRRFLAAALPALILAAPARAISPTHVYIGPDLGNWNTPGNWSDPVVPVNGDSVSILPTGPGKTVIFNGNYAAPGLGDLTIDETGFGTSGISQSAANMVAQLQFIGYSGRGRYDQSGGANTAQTMILGNSLSASGTYQLGGGTLTTNSALIVGNVGSGLINQTGGTLTANRVGLTLAGAGGGSASYYLSNNGSLSANTINNGNLGSGYASIQQTGGGLNATNLINGARGSYNFSGGNLSANLANSGNFSMSGGFFTGGGFNNSSLSLAGGTFTNVTGFTNNGILSLSGGSLLNNNIFSNFGQVQINGNIAITTPFSNDGQFVQNTGIVDFSGAGGFVNNSNMQLAPGWAVNFFNANPINNGSINLNGGRIGGPTVLVNRAGGTITGSGLIFSLDNQGGRILLTSGTFRTFSAISNSGVIELADNAANLAGSALNNSGQVLGHGSIGNELNNSGIVEANGGNLVLGGLITPNFGTYSCPQGGKIIFINGMSGNEALISLTGGTFDNNGFAINNNGQISGFGTFRSGGLTNNGSITFTGGFTTINGNVTNNAAHQLKVAYNPALFTGTVTNNGTFKNTATTITFAGTYIEHGTYISDPADNFFSNVSIGPTGAWQGGRGDRFFISGDFLNSSTNKSAWQTKDAELRFTGGADHLLSVLGQDLGPIFEGYENNFAWGTLSLGPSDGLILSSSNPSGALYVRQLLLADGLNQLSRISSNGLNIYYDLSFSSNTYLHGQTYNLLGGGQIAPVPEPGTLGVAVLSLLIIASCRRKSCALVVQPHYSESSSPSFS